MKNPQEMTLSELEALCLINPHASKLLGLIRELTKAFAAIKLSIEADRTHYEKRSIERKRQEISPRQNQRLDRDLLDSLHISEADCEL